MHQKQEMASIMIAQTVDSCKMSETLFSHCHMLLHTSGEAYDGIGGFQNIANTQDIA
jgi:hypothetical protein